VGSQTLDLVRFVAPRGLPAGVTPIVVSVASADSDPVLSPAVSFRVLPTLREVEPPYAPANGTISLDTLGSSSDESANLITFRWQPAGGGAAESPTFPTLVANGQLSVIVPGLVSGGTVGVEVAGQCSNERSFFRSNTPMSSFAVLAGPPDSGARVAIAPK